MNDLDQVREVQKITHKCIKEAKHKKLGEKLALLIGSMPWNLGLRLIFENHISSLCNFCNMTCGIHLPSL